MEGTQQRESLLGSTDEFNAWLGSFVMCTAAAKGDVAKLKILVESKGQDPNAADYDGRTPLHLASEEGHLEAVEYLVTKGANLNAEDRWGTTPLRGAISNTRNDVVSYLKDRGAALHFTNKHTTVTSNERIKQEEKLAQVRILMQSLNDSLDGNQKDVVSMKSISNFLRESGLSRKKNKLLDSELRSLEQASGIPGVAGAMSRSSPVIASKNSAPVPSLSASLSSGNLVSPTLRLARGSSLEMNIPFQPFCDLMLGETCLLQRAFNSELKLANWHQFCVDVKDIFDSCLEVTGGQNADYIPDLAEVDGSLWGVAIVSVDGQILELGDSQFDFSVQSCGKPLQYSICSEDIGAKTIHKYVGQEPSGVAFNSFTLNADKKPHNPLINSGAIMVSSLFKKELVHSQRFKYLTQRISDLAGGEKIGFNQSVYLSEKGVAHRNFALAHFIQSEGGFPHDVDLLDAVDFYFQMCSLQVNCSIMASIAACYANNGKNPLSNQKVLSSANVKRTLQLMYSCGLYDFSGEWACTIGLPAKSGVSGCIFAVIPEVAGICAFSPPLDKLGNSVRAIEFFKRFIEKFNLGTFDVLFKNY